ncbi:hypothetical protein [Rhabdaerophilum sp. SD176]|uniref:hypothetical protein n=1 Tax=Rhabdaerophilum sp. SD176 TaxID=2983548 RepID=UPI0024E00CD6|nr:hypothetical protein [Rhabdaerophilum sp. SD176]
MFWRATLAIAALYYVTVPAEDRRQAGSELRAAAGQLPGQAIALCQDKPLLCTELARQAGTALAPAAAVSVPSLPATPPAGPEPPAKTAPERRIVEGIPLPPRRPGPHPARKGA